LNTAQHCPAGGQLIGTARIAMDQVRNLVPVRALVHD